MKEGGNGPVPAACVGGERHPAHDLDTARDDQVVVTRGHPGRAEMHGLLGRSALAVDRRGRHALGQPGGDPAVAGDVGALLAHLAHATGDDVVDALGVDAGPLDQRRQGEGEEVGGMPVRQGATALAERRAHDVDDDRLSHLVASSCSSDCYGPWARAYPPPRRAGGRRLLATLHQRLHRLAGAGGLALVGHDPVVEHDGPVGQLQYPVDLLLDDDQRGAVAVDLLAVPRRRCRPRPGPGPGRARRPRAPWTAPPGPWPATAGAAARPTACPPSGAGVRRGSGRPCRPARGCRGACPARPAGGRPGSGSPPR